MTQSLTPSMEMHMCNTRTRVHLSSNSFIHSFLVSFIAVLLLFCRVLCYTDTLKLSHYVYLTRERCPRISVPFPCACCICGNVLCVIKTWTVCGGMSQKSAPFNFPKTEIYMKNKLDNSVKDFSLFTGEFMYSEAEMLVETFFFFFVLPIYDSVMLHRRTTGLSHKMASRVCLRFVLPPVCFWDECFSAIYEVNCLTCTINSHDQPCLKLWVFWQWK